MPQTSYDPGGSEKTRKPQAGQGKNSDLDFDMNEALRRLTDQALSCRPPVKVPRSDRRAPAEPTPNRAAAGWEARQIDQVAAGQLQCLVRRQAQEREGNLEVEAEVYRLEELNLLAEGRFGHPVRTGE
jgi:hypothetical protein